MGNFIFYSQKNSLVDIVGKLKLDNLKISENFTKSILVNLLKDIVYNLYKYIYGMETD